MSATARPLHIVASAAASSTAATPAVVGCAAQVAQLHEVLRRSRQHQAGHTLTLPAPQDSDRPALVRALVDRAVATGAAVTLVDAPGRRRAAADTLFGALCTGRAPVLSPASAYALEVLRGRRMAQIQLLEGLLRRHARHRLILVVVADASGLDEDAIWMLHCLPELLHDAAVTWLHLDPAGDPHAAATATSMPRPTATVSRLPYLTLPEPDSYRGASAGRAQRPKFGWKSLTETEVEVTRLIAEGHSNRTAADALFVSVNTISTHLRSVFTKLDVNSRVQLTRVALRHLSATDTRHDTGTVRSSATSRNH
jgi:DNA-binding CsgD family transcriptional regulator